MIQNHRLQGTVTDVSKLKYGACCLALYVVTALFPVPAQAGLIEYDTVELTSLNKITARTQTFEVKVGETVSFGTISIKPRTCQKSEPIDRPKTAAFLEIWEKKFEESRKWVFSGWMFASSPALSSLDHPVYDVWVKDCLGNTVDVASEDDTEFDSLLDRQSDDDETIKDFMNPEQSDQ